MNIVITKDFMYEETNKILKAFFLLPEVEQIQIKGIVISSHLTHMLIQETLVLQMLIRDKEKGTSFHRSGYAEELDYLGIYNEEEVMFSKTLDETYNYISRLLYSAVKSYDRLSFLLDNSYKGRVKNFLSIWEYYVQGTS